MKKLMTVLITFAALKSFAAVEAADVRVPVGVKPNPILAPLGQLVNVTTGEVLYVNAVISVLTPDQLNKNCMYRVHFTRDKQMKSRVRLVPPMDEIACGVDEAASR